MKPHANNRQKNAQTPPTDRFHFVAKKEIPVKESVGIACCRYGKSGKLEILLIAKRYTYEYSEFVQGRYNSKNVLNEYLMKLFNGMTIEEKLDLLSLDFDKIWYRIWLNIPRQSAYYHAKSKFESNFLLDHGTRLRKLIEKSRNGHKVWEIPKGRKRIRSEPDINCAVREFTEETRIQKKEYKLIKNARRTYSYIDCSVRYKNTYFIAISKSRSEPQVSFKSQDQIDEISDIRWMDIESIRVIDKNNRLETLVKPIFNLIKNHRKMRN